MSDQSKVGRARLASDSQVNSQTDGCESIKKLWSSPRIEAWGTEMTAVGKFTATKETITPNLASVGS